MDHVAPHACAKLLRAITDRIAATPAPSEPDVAALVRHVREASRQAKAELRAALQAQYPEIGWVDENGRPESSKDGTYWVYDPIDGAYHYLQGLPLWSSSLALVRGGETVCALVYDPSSKEMFSATRGEGASMNGQPLAVSAKVGLESAVLATAVAPLVQIGPEGHARALQLLGAAARQAFVVRQMASASLQLAYVAAGRLDGYWEVGCDIGDWLAGALLVSEAGGAVTDLRGQPFDWAAEGVVATCRTLHQRLLTTLSTTQQSQPA